VSLGDPGRACEHLRPLVERLRAGAMVEPCVVPALPLAAEALLGVGEPEGATALADELEAVGRRLDRPWARVTAARCHALAAAAGGESGGASNREIASQLFVSVKTVEANLSRCYRKLGVRSRVQLARSLERDGGRRDAPA
jgi:hypothetical protein